MNRLSTFRRVGLSFAFALFSASIYGEPADKNIVSRTAEIDGVHLHYLTAGHGPAVILLHDFAETMIQSVFPLMKQSPAESFFLM
jgi:hypothetical protein